MLRCWRRTGPIEEAEHSHLLRIWNLALGHLRRGDLHRSADNFSKRFGDLRLSQFIAGQLNGLAEILFWMGEDPRGNKPNVVGSD